MKFNEAKFADFRLYMHNNYPYVLNLYYTVGEKIGDSNIREIDNKYWSTSNVSNSN